MPDWKKPVLPTEPANMITAAYAALRSNDYHTLQHLFHEDFVFTSNAHPEKLDCPVHHVGADKIRGYMALVRNNWEIIRKVAGTPKPQALEEYHPVERGYVYNVTVQIHMRHRKSMLEFIGTKRQEWLIQDGKVSAMSEWLDSNQIDAMKIVPAMV